MRTAAGARVLRCGLVAALYTLFAQPAAAQWQAGVESGARNVATTEWDAAGRRLVRETGWLPGLGLEAAYRAGAVTWTGAAQWYRGSLDYRGRTQGGAPVDSTTGTGLATLRFGAGYAPAPGVTLLAALEADAWRRDIHGVNAAAGLQERYRSLRLLAGAGRAWQFDPGRLTLDAALVLSSPERLRVRFSGRFDDAAFTTRHGRGVRLGARFQPAGLPLALRAGFDVIRHARSSDAPLTADGRFAGTVAQPGHARRAFDLALAAVF